MKKISKDNRKFKKEIKKLWGIEPKLSIDFDIFGSEDLVNIYNENYDNIRVFKDKIMYKIKFDKKIIMIPKKKKDYRKMVNCLLSKIGFIF